MMPYLRKIILILGCSLFVSSHAETYMGMKPDSSLGDIKRMFPNASIVSENAAWVTEADGFYSMTGNGIAGEVFLAFSDGRPDARGKIPVYEAKIAELRKAKKTEDVSRKLNAFTTVLGLERDIVATPTDDALKLKWVRWVPPAPIPFTRYITKYGARSYAGFNNDMRAYRSWPEFGVMAILSDDGQSVLATQFNFTAQEVKDACMAKYNSAVICD